MFQSHSKNNNNNSNNNKPFHWYEYRIFFTAIICCLSILLSIQISQQIYTLHIEKMKEFDAARLRKYIHKKIIEHNITIIIIIEFRVKSSASLILVVGKHDDLFLFLLCHYILESWPLVLSFFSIFIAIRLLSFFHPPSFHFGVFFSSIILLLATKWMVQINYEYLHTSFHCRV